jgi:glycosidase
VFAEGKSIRELPEQLAKDHLYERPGQLVTFLGLHDVDRFMNVPGATDAGLRLAFTFLLTTRGVPLIYSGDELAMAGGGDPDNRRDFPGGWPEDARSAFEAKGRTEVEQRVFECIQRLTRLRAGSAALRRGALRQLAVNDETYAYARVLDGEPAVVMILNNATKPQAVEVPLESLMFSEGAVLVDQLGSLGSLKVERGRLRCTVPARSAAMFQAPPR